MDMYETTKFPLKLYFLNLKKFSAWVYPQKVGSMFTLHTCRSASFCLKPSVWRRLLWLPYQALTQVFLHLWRDPDCKTAQLPYGIFTKNQQNPSNQPTKTKTSQQHNDNKTPKPEQKQKTPKQTASSKQTKIPKQPLLLHFFLVILSLLSHCVLLCSKFTSPISFKFPGLFFTFFWCHRCIFLVWNLHISACRSRIVHAACLLLQPYSHWLNSSTVPHNFSSLFAILMLLFKLYFVYYFCQIFTQCASYRSCILSCLL